MSSSVVRGVFQFSNGTQLIEIRDLLTFWSSNRNSGIRKKAIGDFAEVIVLEPQNDLLNVQTYL